MQMKSCKNKKSLPTEYLTDKTYYDYFTYIMLSSCSRQWIRLSIDDHTNGIQICLNWFQIIWYNSIFPNAKSFWNASIHSKSFLSFQIAIAHSKLFKIISNGSKSYPSIPLYIFAIYLKCPSMSPNCLDSSQIVQNLLKLFRIVQISEIEPNCSKLL